MPILDHFGILAPFYDLIFKPGDRNDLIDRIGLTPSGLLLDAGGGTGRISQYFRDLVDQVYVIDLSEEMLIQANQKGGLVTICSHTEKLPFPDKTFDRIIMIDALHHVCNQAQTAGELYRVLKPGGRIVIEEPDISNFQIKILALLEKILGMRSHFLAPHDISNLFSDAFIRIESSKLISWVIVEPDRTI